MDDWWPVQWQYCTNGSDDKDEIGGVKYMEIGLWQGMEVPVRNLCLLPVLQRLARQDWPSQDGEAAEVGQMT